jgi:putative hydrolase of the HAD superfamily
LVIFEQPLIACVRDKLQVARFNIGAGYARAIGSGCEVKIKAVILDYGEVLCHRAPDEEFNRIAEVFGADKNSFRALWEKNRGAFDRGDITAEAYWMALAEDAGTGIDGEQLEQVYKWDIEMWANVNAEMVNWLRQLRQAGIKTGLLSNMHPAMITHLRENFDWLDLFDFITFSAEVRLIKPDAAIYQHTLRGLGVKAEETLFVDDRESNVKGAQDLGIHAVQFRSVEQLRKDLSAVEFPILPGV